MQSLKHQLIRFLRFLKGDGVQDGPAQLKRFLVMLGLATVLGLLLSPLALLVTLPHSNEGTASTGSTPGTTVTPSGATPTQDPNTKPGAPIKGLTDNPAYQWWRWPNHPQPDSWWGDKQTAQTLGVQISLMKELDVKLFRPELVWSFVAPTRPGGSTYNSTLARDPNWSGYHWDRWDLIVQLTAAAGIQLVPQVVYTPDWASGVTTTTNGGPNDPPQSAQYFGDFVFAAVTRYKGRIHYWEMWNEPDYPDHTWNATMKQYVDLILKPGYQAVKQVDSTAQVLLGGLANGSMDAVYAAGARSYFDIGNFHAYLPSVGGNNAEMDFVRGTMNQNGDSNKPLWLTEFGYEAYDKNTESDQAYLVHDEFNGPDLQAILFYQLHDTDVFDATDTPIKEAAWGLVSRDFSRHKPSFAAFKAAIGGPLPTFTSASSALLAPFSPSLLPVPTITEAVTQKKLAAFRQRNAVWAGAARLLI